ncbi:MAG: thioredoxin-disulfide reductase [bacterium]
MENVIIIGSGCAGWTAAIYAARAGLKPLVLTGKQPGGLLTTTTIVENYPGFPDGIDGIALMENMQKQAERFGARTQLLSAAENVDFSQKPFRVVVDGERIETKTVIVAVGASHRHLNVPGEKELENKGVTYCATCDGALPIFRDKPLVVVGGGDSACEEALHLTRFGSVVHLVHRRGELRASKIMAERVLKHEKIQPVWNTVVEEILDAKKGEVTGARLRHVETEETVELACAGVFVAIGHVPSTDIFKERLEMNEHGYLRLKEGSGSQTSVPGVFAAGDCVDAVYRQAVTAAGMGCMAAIDAGRYLSSHS